MIFSTPVKKSGKDAYRIHVGAVYQTGSSTQSPPQPREKQTVEKAPTFGEILNNYRFDTRA